MNTTSTERTTERERQAAHPDAIGWRVAPTNEFATSVEAVTCNAPTAEGALRVAYAEHPGVTFRWPEKQDIRSA